MKGFLISVAVIVALIVIGISQVSNISMSLLEKAQVMEGGPAAKEAVERLKLESPSVFRQKYDEAFKFRIWAAKISFYLAEDDAFKFVAGSTREFYLGTEFDKEDPFAWMLLELAKTLEDRQPNIFYERLLEIQEHCPQASNKVDVERRIKLMKVRLNIAFARPNMPFC